MESPADASSPASSIAGMSTTLVWGSRHGTAGRRVNLETTITAWQLILACGTTLVVSGIAWGSLLQRVRTLEGHVAGVPEIDKRLTRVETVVEGIQDDVTEIKTDVREVLHEVRSFASEPRGRGRSS